MVKPLTELEVEKIDQMIGLLHASKTCLKVWREGYFTLGDVSHQLRSIELRLRTRNL